MANVANYMEGPVTAYSGTSFTVNVDHVGGSGTLADWQINVAGDVGATGATGPSGSIGGTGTVGTVGKWVTNTTTMGNSSIADDGTTVTTTLAVRTPNLWPAL